MSMVVAHNMSAINTKRQFSSSARGMSSAMEKLSSGYKINSGKDDPSGLVISEKLRSQINGLQRAQQNTEEAINVMGIAEGALNEMNNILKKMKALAIHSSNTGVTSAEQIAADQAEMDSSIQTLDRIAQTTDFSGEKLLNGAKDIAYDRDTLTKGTQQNSLLNTRESNFSQIFKRDSYSVAINYTGTKNAAAATGVGDVDFSQQAMKAYLEVDTVAGQPQANVDAEGNFTRDQAFTLTGKDGSRAFRFKIGDKVTDMVSQIKSAADSTGIDAALVFNSAQEIAQTTNGTSTIGAVPARDKTFTIEGINSTATDAEGNETVSKTSFTLDAGIEEYMLNNEDVSGFKFQVSSEGEKVALSVSIDDGDTFIALTKGWDGTADGLWSAITEQMKYDDANTELLSAMRENLSLTNADGVKNDINVAESTISASYELSGPTEVSLTMENVFGPKVGNDENGTVDGTIKMDWNKIYASIADEDKAAFIEDVNAGEITVKMSLSGDKQSELGVQIDIINDNGKVYLTKKQDLTAEQKTQLANNDYATGTPGSATISIGGDGAFAGSEFVITNGMATNGYDPTKPVNADGVIATPVGLTATFTAGAVTKESINVGSTTVTRLASSDGTLTPVTLNNIFGGVLGDGSVPNGKADVNVEVNWDRLYNELTGGKDVDFKTAAGKTGSGSLQTTVGITGGTQGNLGIKIEIGEESAATGKYLTHTVTLNDKQKQALKDNGEVEITLTSEDNAYLAGTTIKITDVDTSKIGYVPGKALTAPAGTAAAGTGTVNGDFTTVKVTSAKAISAAGSPAASDESLTALNGTGAKREYTIAGLFADDGTQLKLVTTGANASSLSDGTATLSFAIELDEGKSGSAPTYTLYALAGTGERYSVVTGWNGQAATLDGLVKAGTLTYVDGGGGSVAAFVSDVEKVLGMSSGGGGGGVLALEGGAGIDLARSAGTGGVFIDGLGTEDLAAGAIKYSNTTAFDVATNIYGPTAATDKAGTLKLNFGDNFDFSKILNNAATKGDALRLRYAMAANALAVSTAFTANADGSIAVTLKFGTSTVPEMSSATFTIGKDDLDANGNTGGDKTVASGDLAGLTFSISGGVDKSTYGFNGDSTALGAVTDVTTGLAGGFVDINDTASVTSLNVYAGEFDSAAKTDFTLKYLQDAGGVAVKLSVDCGVGGGIVAGNALIGKSVAFGVKMNAGADAENPTYTLVATVDGKDYFLTDTWDGTTTTITTNKNTAYTINGITEDNTADVAVLNALLALNYEVDRAIDTEKSNAAYIAQTGITDTKLFDSVASKDRLTTNAVIVANNLYDSNDTVTTDGQLEVKFEKFNLDQLDRNGADMKKILAALTAKNLTVKAHIVNMVNDKNEANGKFTVTLALADTNGTEIHQIGSFSSDALKLDVNGETLDNTGKSGTAPGNSDGGWVTLNDPNSPLNGLKIRITNTDKKNLKEYVNDGTAMPTTPVDASLLADTVKADAVGSAETAESGMILAGATDRTSAISQTGGLGEARQSGTVAVFNNTLKAGTGEVLEGVAGVTITEEGANSVMFGNNTDGQGRIYVKFLDDNSFELYKDASLSKESLVASGRNGEEIKEANNSGLTGFTLDLAGSGLASKTGVYMSLAGIEGTSGIRYSEAVVNTKEDGNFAESGMFDADRTLLSGVELGTNTSEEGQLYFKNVFKVDADTGEATIQVFAYKHKDMKDADMVAKSTTYAVGSVDENGVYTQSEDAEALTVVLNEIRNSDNTQGTGLGIVLSVDGGAFDGSSFQLKRGESTTLNGNLTFTNLAARVFAKDYGSDAFIKVTQDKGAIFTQYGTNGDNSSKRLIDAGSDGVSVEVRGQDANLSINGMQVKTNGLKLSLATQDIQASLTFNEGKVGSTTLAQVGYGVGSIFTKIGALNLGSAEKITTGDYAGLSGLLNNAGHVTTDKIGNFSNGMQLQLGEGAGDQNRTIVAIKSMTSENLGRVSKGGFWETGSAVYTEKIFTMKDVMGGGQASLKQNATLAMAIIDQAISDVTETRAVIGAFQTNLLQTNSNNLSVTIENITKTESGIRDADMADEMAEFTKQQVLQNAAMSMMSQANQASQNVLQLLR